MVIRFDYPLDKIGELLIVDGEYVQYVVWKTSKRHWSKENDTDTNRS